LSILNSAKGGKGGVSGKPVREIALKAIKAIRDAVGDDIPIIGMGGVTDGPSCADLIASGADAVGIGSALAHVGQKNWAPYFAAVKAEASALLCGKKVDIKSSAMLSKGSLMNYRPYKVTEKKYHCEDTALLTLDGKMEDFKAGEFVFIWIPGVGEKPFSVAKTDPLTFIIKKRGVFTQAVFDKIEAGDTVYLRGPYGTLVETPKAKKAIILAGGTGEAVALPLAQKLEAEKTEMIFLVGTSVDGDRGILEKELSKFGSYRCISDAGKPGRILESLPDAVKKATKDGTNLNEVAFYLIGPEVFMKIASGKIEGLGVCSDMVMLSMERNTMCGVGLCGECSCGGHLSCQWGTFMSLSFLEKENVL
ncbi:MAG: dihydroorotate dehydrogenase, partial [Spirochaetales bacterium]|nr:dihydroorotate dehydrogenase [Spirochaetales bacterium]